MLDEPADLLALLRDTVYEAARSWRLPASLALGVGFGLIERNYSHHLASFAFGPAAALYTLFLGPLPWRALVPLVADGQRLRKLARWCVAAAIGCALFAAMMLPYAMLASAISARGSYILRPPRELVVSLLLFLVGGWGLARDIQLEQRLDRSLRSHGVLAAELEEARLYALRADLDPHFLFNALNAIASQCASDPGQAEENVVRLSSLLRAVLDTRRSPLHPLEDELALARDYLGLLAARYPSLRFAIDADPAAMALLVPPLVLQPLLENAVRHGAIEHGAIDVAARLDARGGLLLEVRSPGVFRGGREGGMGLELVRRRTELAWGSAAAFAIGAEASGTVARITVEPTAAHAAARSAA